MVPGPGNSQATAALISRTVPVMIALSLISIIYGAAAAIASKNLLRLVSYTSVSHFGFMVLGIYAFTTQAQTGSIFYMFSHGLSAASLFLVVGFIIDRRGSADIRDLRPTL
mgnify:CR=1 FL=1